MKSAHEAKLAEPDGKITHDRGSSTAVQINHLSVTIGAQKILHDISAQLPVGSITGLLGPSGAGKTTLMRCIVGLQRHFHGTIEVLGHKAGARALRSQIGYMTQNLSIYQDLTVAENLEYFARLHGVNTSAVEHILRDLDLTAQQDVLVGNVSGGQKSRVSLGAALLGQPRLLVLDEPTVGIDPVLRAQIWEQLKQLSANGTTLVVSSHVMEEAEHCDNIILLRDGGVLAHDSPSSLMKKTNTKNIESAFLQLVRSNI